MTLRTMFARPYRQDAAQAPHVDPHVVRQPQDHFRRPVEAALDVRVHPLVLKAARTKVDHLTAGPCKYYPPRYMMPDK